MLFDRGYVDCNSIGDTYILIFLRLLLDFIVMCMIEYGFYGCVGLMFAVEVLVVLVWIVCRAEFVACI